MEGNNTFNEWFEFDHSKVLNAVSDTEILTCDRSKENLKIWGTNLNHVQST